MRQRRRRSGRACSSTRGIWPTARPCWPMPWPRSRAWSGALRSCTPTRACRTPSNTNDAAAAKRNGRVQGLWGQVMAAIAFLDPELLAIGEATLRKWLAEEPRLAYLGHYIDNLFRKQAHVRSAEVEELLGLFAAPSANVETTFSMLTDADFKFPAAVTRAATSSP